MNNLNTENSVLQTSLYQTILVGQFPSTPSLGLLGSQLTNTASLDRLMSHPLVSEALQVLDKLPEGLYYHNKQHTVNVISAAVKCAELDGISSRDLELLAIAAAWHDTGYIIRRNQNEIIGADLAREAMIRTGLYLPEEIAQVTAAILDTEVAMDPASASFIQTARGRLSPWLLDGDLSNFGSSDYMRISLSLLREFSGFHVRQPEDLRDPRAISFIAGSIRMMCHHKFQSDGGKQLFQSQKDDTLRALADLLAQVHGGTDVSLGNAWNALMPNGMVD